jgi:lipopolysaccharide heptosyltransferase I
VRAEPARVEGTALPDGSRTKPARIALVKLSSLGDVVHALPLAAALRARFPATHLTWVVERREAALLVNHPALDDIVIADTRGWRRARGLGGGRAAAGALWTLARRLRRERFDVAIDAQGLLKSGMLVALTRAPLRIGFAARVARELSALCTNCHVTPPPEARHVVDQYLALLEPLGIARPRVEFTLPVAPRAEAEAEAFLAGASLEPRRRLVTLVIGAARPDKRWALACHAELATRLIGGGDTGVLVLWGPGEEADARAIAEGARGAVLAPPTDLGTLLALLRRASVIVGGDTGPLHMGAALGVPCVGLYGPTAATRNGPYGTRHRALQSPDGTLAGLSVATVLAAVRELVA